MLTSPNCPNNKNISENNNIIYILSLKLIKLIILLRIKVNQFYFSIIFLVNQIIYRVYPPRLITQNNWDQFYSLVRSRKIITPNWVSLISLKLIGFAYNPDHTYYHLYQGGWFSSLCWTVFPSQNCQNTENKGQKWLNFFSNLAALISFM